MATKIDVKALEGNWTNLKTSLFKPEEMARYVRQCKAGLHSYSLNNYLLAIMQYPRTSVSLVTENGKNWSSSQTWRERD